MAPEDGNGGAVFGAGEGGVDALHGHATGEELEGGGCIGIGGVFGEGLVDLGGLGAGDDFDDIGAVGRADLDLEAAFVGAGDVDGFVGGDEGVSGEAVREEDDGGAIALVAEDGDVTFAG